MLMYQLKLVPILVPESVAAAHKEIGEKGIDAQLGLNYSKGQLKNFDLRQHFTIENGENEKQR